MIIWLIGGVVLVLCLDLSGSSSPLTLPVEALSNAALDSDFVAKAALFFAVLLLWTIFIGKIAKQWLKLPIIAGQIVGGVLLGPSCLDVARWPFFSSSIQLLDNVTHHVCTLVFSDLFIFFVALLSSVFTISYLLWIAGYETNIKSIAKVGVPAVSAGFFGAIFPVIMGWFVLYYGWPEEILSVQAVAMGLVFSATSVSIPVAMLFAANKMHLKSSQATLGAAIIDDILAVVLLSLFFIGIQTGRFGREVLGLVESNHATTMGEALVYMLVAFATFAFLGYYCIPPIARWLKRHQYYYLIPAVATGVMLIYFACAERLGGLAGITGAYFAGLFHRLGESGHQAEKVISPFVSSILLPLFLGSIGLTVDITLLKMSQWIVVLVLLGAAIISKLLACYCAIGLANILQKEEERWTVLEGFIFGSSMIARGEVGLVMATILYGARLIPTDYYIIALVVIILTTVASPIMLGIGFSWIEAQEREEDEFTLKMGHFKIFGTAQLFNSIVNHIQDLKGFHPSIKMSEGSKIINLEDQRVQVIFSPDRGILFKGDQANVSKLVHSIKEELSQELEKISTA